MSTFPSLNQRYEDGEVDLNDLNRYGMLCDICRETYESAELDPDGREPDLYPSVCPNCWLDAEPDSADMRARMAIYAAQDDVNARQLCDRDPAFAEAHRRCLSIQRRAEREQERAQAPTPHDSQEEALERILDEWLD